jgi:hypothetical protein
MAGKKFSCQERRYFVTGAKGALVHGIFTMAHAVSGRKFGLLFWN